VGETVTYARPEGEELKLDVWRPPSEGVTTGQRRAAVVVVHGGGGIQGGPSQEAPWSEWLAREGYVVISIDYRAGSTGTPPRLSGVPRGPRDPPTFLAHGHADQFVPSEQSELLANRLEEASVPQRLIELPGARHGFDAAWGGWSSQIVRRELEEFLERRLADQDADAR
jgi:acetyl esterase/lipase